MVIEVKSNQIITEWWTSKEDEDGKKQSTKETVHGKNKGRSNETSDKEQALLEFERKVKKKKEVVNEKVEKDEAQDASNDDEPKDADNNKKETKEEGKE